MTDQIKKLAPIIWPEIQKANKILLRCHPNPDGDSVGGVLAMKHALTTLGKEVTVIWGDSTPPHTFQVFRGIHPSKQKTIFK